MIEEKGRKKKKKKKKNRFKREDIEVIKKNKIVLNIWCNALWAKKDTIKKKFGS